MDRRSSTINSNSRRQRARQIKMELVAAYNNQRTGGSNRSSGLAVRHLLPSFHHQHHHHQHQQHQQQPAEKNVTTRTPRVAVVDEIRQDPSLLWEPFAGGCTLMHWAAQHLRHEQIDHSYCRSNTETTTTTNNNNNNNTSTVVQIWKSLTTTGQTIADPWAWLLDLATQHPDAARLFVDQRDSGGESCLDCFMSAWHYGCRRNDPYQFGAAVEAIRQQPHLLYSLQRLVKQQNALPLNSSFSCGSKPLARAGDRRVVLVAKVWKAWTRLCRAAHQDDDDMNNNSNNNTSSLITFMAKTGRALESFAWLAVTLHPTECRDVHPITRETPLHLWAASQNSNSRMTAPTEEMDALWMHLLRAHPEAVTLQDATGRLPLHYALSRANKPLRQALVLALACPDTLGVPDPAVEDGTLYPFATATLAARLEVRAMLRATQRRPPSQRLYDWLDTTRRDLDTYEQEVSTVLLGHVYLMLRALPQALEYTRHAVTAQIIVAADTQAKGGTTPSRTSSTAAHVPTVAVKDAYAKVLHDLV